LESEKSFERSYDEAAIEFNCVYEHLPDPLLPITTIFPSRFVSACRTRMD